MHTTIGNDIVKAARFLEKGEVVAIPTETVYGLAGNALNEDAAVKIFEAKNRPSFNPLIVHVKSWQDAQRYVQRVPEKAGILAQHFSPGPITFLLYKKDIIPDLVTAGSDKVAIRIPNHPVAAALLQQLDFPLAAPSANPFGYVSPTTAQHVYEGLNHRIPYILDGGAAEVGIESTIIGFDENNAVILYRNGGISATQIENLLGEKVRFAQLASEKNPETAGQLKSHYAPHKPLYLGDTTALRQQFSGKKIASISFRQPVAGVDKQYILSPEGNIAEAAKKLFATLREADKLEKIDVIIAEYFPEEGIGRAINDRLKKAQAENKR